jgi:hypothetical protein
LTAVHSRTAGTKRKSAQVGAAFGWAAAPKPAHTKSNETKERSRRIKPSPQNKLQQGYSIDSPHVYPKIAISASNDQNIANPMPKRSSCASCGAESTTTLLPHRFIYRRLRSAG